MAIARIPPDVDTAALLPKEVYVDDIIGGLTVVRLTPPDGPEIRFCLSADAARVLGIALTAAADISDTTGWGRAREGHAKAQTREGYTRARSGGARELTPAEYEEVYEALGRKDFKASPTPTDQPAAVGENVAKLATALGKVANRPTVSDPTPGE